MSLESGRYTTLTVERDSPFGYFLSDGEEDVLLHYSETKKEKLEIGSSIDVFLYNDHKGRIAATLSKPIIVMGEIDFLELKDYQPKMGFFLDNGIDKEVLLPIAELPEEKEIWPMLGERLLVELTHDKQDRLLAKLVKEDYKIEEYIEQQQLNHKEEQQLEKNQWYEGVVLKHLSVGAHIYLENNQIAFIHRSEQLKELRLGEKVKVRISFIRDDERLNVTMKPLKQVSRIDDADKILEVLKDRGGAMPYWDKTPSDIIQTKFQLSKAAFKRAIGKLLKDGIIYQEDGWTYLKEKV